MGLQIRRAPSVKFRVITTIVAVFALIAQPLYGVISYRVANAASALAVSPSSLSIDGGNSGSSTADASNFADISLSFSYDARNLEQGDTLQYGWSAGNGTDQPLGTIDGQTNVNNQPGAGEVGSTTIQLPSAADVSNLTLFFNNNGAVNDTVTISNIALTGTANAVIPTYGVSSTLPATVTKGVPVEYDVTTTTTDTSAPWVKAFGSDGGAGGTYEYQDNTGWHAFNPAAGFGPFQFTNGGTTHLRATYTNIGTFTQTLRFEKLDGTTIATATSQQLTVNPAPTPAANTVCADANACEYQTIQAAVDDASAGDTITVKSGTYNETVTINKALTLKAESGVTLKGDFTVSADNVTIDGFTIDDSGTAVFVIASNDVTLSHNIVTKADDNYTDGFEINSGVSDNLTISNNTFTDGNSNKDNDADVSFIGDPNQVSHGLVINSNTSTNGATFVNLGNASGASIHDNSVTGASGSAIYFAGNDVSTSITKNSITGGAGTAVNVSNFFYGPSFYTTVDHNNFSNNATGLKVNTGTVNAQQNWWGSASGPTDNTSGDGSNLDKNQNGTGSPAVGAVNYSPWCTSADCSTDSSVAPGTPTGLFAQFQYDAAHLSSGSTLNKTSEPGGNNLELEWTAPAGWVNGYQILGTDPSNQTQHVVGGGGPNTNSWLVANGFGQHGQGAYTYRVVAVNDNGQSTLSDTFTLYYDTQSPTAEFTKAPNDNSFVNDNFHVEATVSDNVALRSAGFDVRDPHDTTGNSWRAGCVAGTLKVTQTDARNETLSCDINTANLVEGQQYYVRVHAGDNAGYGSKDVAPLSIRHFTVDRTAPLHPTNLEVNGQTGTFYTKVGAAFTQTWKDKSKDVAGYNYQSCYVSTVPTGNTCSGTSFTSTYGSASKQVNAGDTKNDEVFFWRMQAVDAAGNLSGWSNWSEVVVDSTPPQIQFTNPDRFNDPSYDEYFQNLPDIAITATDNNSVASTLVHIYNKDGSFSTAWCGAAVVGSAASCDTSSLADGSYFVKVAATDKAGNTTYATKDFTIDSTPPTATVTYSPNSLTNGNVLATLTTSEKVNDITGWTRKSDTVFQKAYPKNDKSPNWNQTVVFEDAAGNTGSTNVYIDWIDITAPVISTSVTNGTVNGTQVLDLNANEAHPSVYNIRVLNSNGAVASFKDGTNVPGLYVAGSSSSSVSYSWDTTRMNDGTYTVQFSARDAAGNPATSIFRTLIVDNIAPTSTLSVTPDNTVARSGNKVTFSGLLTNAADLNTLGLYDSNNNFIADLFPNLQPDGSWQYTMDMSGLAAGDFNYYVKAGDALGNVFTSNLITVHVASFVPSATERANAIKSLGSPATIFGTAVFSQPLTQPASQSSDAKDGDTAVLGAKTKAGNSDTTPLAATPQGWKIFGIAWYWILILIAIIGSGIWWTIVTLRRRAADMV